FLRLRVLHAFPTRRSSDLGYPPGLYDGLRFVSHGNRQLWIHCGGAGDRALSPGEIRDSAEGRRLAINTEVTVFAISQVFNLKIRSEEHTSELQSRENLVCR